MNLRQISIKNRLILSGVVLALGMIIMFILRIYQADQATSLASAQQHVEQLRTDVLMLRRNEKDFLLRSDAAYLNQFEQNAAKLQNDQTGLTDTLNEHDIDASALAEFGNYIDAYEDMFRQLVAESTAMGLNEEEGLQGELRSAVHSLEEAFTALNLPELQVTVLTLRRHEKDFMLRSNANYIQRFETALTQLKNQINNADLNDASRTSLINLADNYSDAFLQYTASRQRIGLDETSGLMGEMRETVHQTETSLTELTDTITAVIADTQRQIELLSYIIFIVLLTAVLGFILATSRSIIKPLQDMVDGIDAIADNSDLRVRMSEQGKDELTRVNVRFNEMMERFQTLIQQLSLASDQVAASSEQLSAVSEEVSNIAQEQEQQTNMIATAITQMAAAVQEVATNAQGASESADDADKEAKSGYDKVSANIHAMEALAASVLGTSERLHTLNERTTEISSVVEVIQNIAEQTNLLALNAAIEAARAGEQGRGFAVVADEVRSLAANTKKSTETIQETTQRLLRGANEATEAMQVSSEQADESMALAKETGLAFQSVSRAVGKVVDVNIQISTATEEQTAVAGEITENVNGLAESIREVVTGANQCAEASHQLSELASDLKGQVQRFKVA